MRSPAREILAKDGPVAAALGEGFEPRQQQLEMAAEVERALAAKSRLLAEAGTGVGKSFAYLVPAMLRCATSSDRIVIATNTIALQEQLIKKDVPFLLSTIDQWGLDPATRRAVVPALVKGRNNYVSLRRLEMASDRQAKVFPDEASRRSLHVIEDWAMETEDGSLSTLPSLERPAVWDRVQSDSDNCMGRKCRNYEQCYYQKSRRMMEQANLLICNHAVFFADLSMRAFGVAEDNARPNAGFLGKYNHVILDEGHMVEDVACDHFGLGLTESRVEHYLGLLYHSRTGKGYLPHLELQLPRKEPLDEAIKAVLECSSAGRALFESLHGLHRSGQLKSGRVPAANLVENHLSKALSNLAARLKLLKDLVSGEEDKFELNGYAVRAEAIAFDAHALITQERAGFVYWLEGAEESVNQSRRPGTGPRLKLACSPIEVGPLLKTHLWEQEIGLILTSATLATKATAGTVLGGGGAAGGTATKARVARRVVVDDDGETQQRPPLPTARDAAGDLAIPPGSPFHHIASRLGCDAARTTTSESGASSPVATRTLQLGSPFDHARQLEFIVDIAASSPKSAGTYSRGGAGAGASASGGAASGSTAYHDTLAERILFHVKQTDGGAFVLFTSFASLNAVAERIEPHLQRARLPLLAQGRDGPAATILERFRQDERSVLLGAASFWQGVDVKGRALRNVIITKLPFDPPDRPIVEARCERITARGGNPFSEDSLPRAILRFKQGFGRLIRSSSDFGRVVVLDPRIVTARYGRLFIEALPPGVRVQTIQGESDEQYEQTETLPF